MAQCVLESNVLLRAVAPTSAHQTAAVAALKRASIRGDELFLAPQVRVERAAHPLSVFWAPIWSQRPAAVGP